MVSRIFPWAVVLGLQLALSNAVLGLSFNPFSTRNSSYEASIYERQTPPPGQCSNNYPCADGSCCNGLTFYCGLDPAHCDLSVCISNCNATAECGIGAAIPGSTCPLNVCCGQYGYCGVTTEFCEPGCQSNCQQPASTGLSSGSVQNIVIGYFESWNLITPTCANVDLSFIRTDSLTHLNVAFGYIQPDTYTIYPIPGTGIEQFQQLTNLKQSAPGLQIWLSLGGWTYSDNGTDTQPVFGDLASSVEKRRSFIESLVSFMTEWGFDGVDIDWEYPGAPDRNGKPEDTANYVLLLQDMKTYFQLRSLDYGISFTAPTSYWYLQWFDIGNMTLYVDWVNLMTYDLHGSWDSPSDDIGSYVFAHTNLTEIKDALDLFWRNFVPASQINLGLGFYGRTYTLSDSSCYEPGCPFTSGGVAGPCTGTSGFLSYAEISEMMEVYSYQPFYDKVAGVNYMVFDNNQWVSFDDVRTIQQKVTFANDQGLLGLFIWAIDEDSTNHALLNATLFPDGLGKFKGQTGSGYTDNSNYTGVDVSQCAWTGCSASPQCSAGTLLTTTIRCSLAASGSVQYQSLCCPLDATPDPSFCTWRAGPSDGKDGFCTPGCNQGETSFASGSWAVIDGGNVHCFSGTASYCCETVETGSSLCGWNPVCTTLGSNGQPTDSNACPGGQAFVTYAKSGNGLYCDGAEGSPETWLPYCCVTGTYPTWYWAGTSNLPIDCSDAKTCKDGFTGVGLMEEGQGSDCQNAIVSYTTPAFTQFYPEPKTLCVDINDLQLTVNNLPVPLANLFPTASSIPLSDKQTWDVELDPTMGGADPEPNGSTDPNENSFGWHIMSGPADEMTTMDKRDGSHWDVFDCENAGTKRQTAKAVCIDESESSNCGVIRLGRGVAETVVEMPAGCGPGKYAMAVSLEPSVNQTLPHRLVKRGLKHPIMYDFVFDYDFTPLQRRAGGSNTLLRIDYSDDPGYWNTIVAAAPKHRMKSKREMNDLAEIVRRDHNGSWKRYMEYEWQEDKRSTPDHELHLLHERWFSSDLADWLSKLLTIDDEYTLFRHNINQQMRWLLFEDSIECTLFGIPAEAYFAAWADLDINIATTAQLTLIGNLGDLSSFDESHILVRNSGSVKASLNIEALATLKFTTGQIKLVGADQFGGTFGIPGLVTIGPNFQVFGEISGTATIHAEARVDFNIYNWDYTQQYPNVASDEPPDENDVALVEYSEMGAAAEDTNDSGPTFYYDVGAEGQIRISITPQASFGISWTNDAVPDTTINLGVETSLTVYGEVGSNSGTALSYCYGANIDIQVYASISAPAIFHLTNRWLLYAPNGAIDVIPQTCSSSESSLQSDGVMDTWSQLDAGN